MLTITHTSAQGTLLHGTTKGDGAWEAIKAAGYRCSGWRYFRSMGQFGVHMSRDRAPKLYLIDATAKVLREAGFEVEVEIDGAPRDYAEAEGDRAERMEDRAEALHAKAERKAGERDARWAAADRLSDAIPMGQPILVGHHSERRHRRDLERIQANGFKGLEAHREAQAAAAAAKSAERHMDYRENPTTVLNRLERLRADLGRAQRALTGHTRTLYTLADGTKVTDTSGPATGRHREQRELDVQHLTSQISYWEGLVAERKAAGDWGLIDLADIKKGDDIGFWGGRATVTRVNKVSVSIRDTFDGKSFFSRTVKASEIKRHWPAASTAPAVDLDPAPVNTAP